MMMEPVRLAKAPKGQAPETVPEQTRARRGLERDVLASLAHGVLVVDAELTIVYRNAQAARWLPTGDKLQNALQAGRVLPPFEGWAKELQTVVRTGASRSFEFAAESEQDEAGPVFTLHCTPLRSTASGTTGEVVVLISDGSHLAGLEERLAVSERLASIGKLASRIAHELNNPLDGILRYINLSLRLLKDTPEPKLKSYLDESRTGLKRMVQIISELLEFSRATHGQFDLTAINDLVDQAIREFTPRAQAHGIVITADYQEKNMPAIRGGRLYQVCCNLIKNAIDAMPGGGRLTISTGRVDQHVVLRVADTGPGLPEDVSRIFEPFYTTKQVGQGAGLGLAISKDFVEDMGGTLEGKTDPEGGAVFTVRIPLSSCHSEREKDSTHPTRGSHTNVSEPAPSEGS
jgi:signal transduction histidine kinase